jgi:hypothetical protein
MLPSLAALQTGSTQQPQVDASGYKEESLDMAPSDPILLHVKFRKKVSAEYAQRADQGDSVGAKFTLLSDPGWHLLIGRSILIEDRVAGDHSQALISEGPDGAVWSVTTIHHEMGTTGRVAFRLSIVEYQ